MRKSENQSLGFEDGRVTGFVPRFKSIDDDWERYVDALLALEKRGLVPAKKGQSLYGLYCADLTDWLTDAYFDAGRLDQIEAHFTPTGEVAFGPPYPLQRKVMERFLALGEGARVRRMWRAHLGHMKGHYWFYVAERRKGFRLMKKWIAPEAEQRAAHEQTIARVEPMKATLLDMMAEALAQFHSTNAPEAEIARLRTDIDAVRAEQRPGPQGKPDPRKMDEDLFWALIDDGLGDDPLGARLDSLPERLASFSATAIRAFEKILRDMDQRACRWDIWALAYLLQGGCSDDAFDAFRGWLILQGRAVFEATLANPDGFDVGLHSGQAGGMTGLRDAAPLAYDMRQGKPMPPVKTPPLQVLGPEIAEQDFAAALPRIARLKGLP